MMFLDYFFGTKYLSEEEIKGKVDELVRNDRDISYLYQMVTVPIKIEECGEGIRAMYNIRKREILISPFGFDEKSLREALLHEMVHAYDHQFQNIDLNTIEGLAKSEIHAMKECECSSCWFPRKCTMEKAIEAVDLSIGNRNKAKEAVESVFETGFNDNIFYHRDDADEFESWPQYGPNV